MAPKVPGAVTVAGGLAAVAGARARRPPLRVARSLSNPTAPLPPPQRPSSTALPREDAAHAAAALGALGSLGVLLGVYRMPLNRCRCSREARDEAAARSSKRGDSGSKKRHGARRMLPRLHCGRCLKRTRGGIAVSFLTSPIYCACAAVGMTQAAHVVGTPLLEKIVKPAVRKARSIRGRGRGGDER